MTGKELLLRNNYLMPKMSMSANWYSQKQMRDLFVEGIKNGVVAFDCAREYNSEHRTGLALKGALEITGFKRENVFITTRISNFEIRKGQIRKEVERSLRKMSLDYVDCFMFHWPTPEYYITAWKELEKVYEEGLCKSIGMCNLRERHIIEMYRQVEIMPHVIQIEVHPLRQAQKIVDMCTKYKIAVQAFSPLCKMIPLIRENKMLCQLANKYQVTVAQLILHWHIQRGLGFVSLTSKVERIKSNYDLFTFEISPEDMMKIKELNSNYKFHLESASCPGF